MYLHQYAKGGAHTITRPVCFTGEPPNPRLCSVEARPIQPRDRCISTGFVKSIPVCIPAILPFEQSIKQSTTRSGPKNDTLKVENFAGAKFRGSKKPRNFCVSRVLNFAVAPSKYVSRVLNFAVAPSK